MAWTEVCILNFCTSCEAVMRTRGLKISHAIREFSDQSGIPASTLKGWWYDYQQEKLKAVKAIEEMVENDSTGNRLSKENEELDTTPRAWSCRACGKSEPEVSPALGGSGKPLSTKSKHYGLCKKCWWESKHNKDKNNKDGKSHICSHCGNKDTITFTTIVAWYREYQKGKEQNGKTG